MPDDKVEVWKTCTELSTIPFKGPWGVEPEKMTFSFRKPKIFFYKPKEDITAYELDLCLPAFSFPRDTYYLENVIDALPPEAKRHFEERVE